MTRQYRFIAVEKKKDVFCIRLRQRKMDEAEVNTLTEEVLSLISDQESPKIVLSLGPEEPQCLYSVFLAKLITLRRRLTEKGGALVIADASPAVIDVFDACQLKNYFEFAADQKAALLSFAERS